MLTNRSYSMLLIFLPTLGQHTNLAVVVENDELNINAFSRLNGSKNQFQVGWKKVKENKKGEENNKKLVSFIANSAK